MYFIFAAMNVHSAVFWVRPPCGVVDGTNVLGTHTASITRWQYVPHTWWCLPTIPPGMPAPHRSSSAMPVPTHHPTQKATTALSNSQHIWQVKCKNLASKCFKIVTIRPLYPQTHWPLAISRTILTPRPRKAKVIWYVNFCAVLPSECKYCIMTTTVPVLHGGYTLAEKKAKQ